jgi:small subunit ribosomal protein S6
MNEYEIMLLLDAELAEEHQAEIVARARELVERHGGTWQGHDPWGRRRLAYEIEKKTEAFYHLLYFKSDAATLDELTRVLSITDGAVRHMAVRRTTPIRKHSAFHAEPAEPVGTGTGGDA